MFNHWSFQSLKHSNLSLSTADLQFLYLFFFLIIIDVFALPSLMQGQTPGSWGAQALGVWGVLRPVSALPSSLGPLLEALRRQWGGLTQRRDPAHCGWRGSTRG